MDNTVDEIRDLKHRLAHAERRSNDLVAEIERLRHAHRLFHDKVDTKFCELYAVVSRIDKAYLSVMSNSNMYQPLQEDTHVSHEASPCTLRETLMNTR